MGEQWYCMVVGQEVGPITTEDLATMLEQGQIDADDPVRAGTAGTWRPVREVLDVLPGTDNGTATTTAASATWYARMLDSEFGPYTFEEIRELAAQEQLAPDDEIREGTNGRWQTASTLPGLFTQSAIRQRLLEIEQARSEAEQRKKERKQQRRSMRRSSAKVHGSDDLLDGLGELEDAEESDAATVGTAFTLGTSLPSDPVARAEMLKRLDAEYERLRNQLTQPNGAVHAPATGVPPSPSPSAERTPPRPVTPPPLAASPGTAPPRSTPVIPVQNDLHREPPSPLPTPPEPPESFGSSRSPAADMMREMAAAQLRSAQPPARIPPRAAVSSTTSRSSGGSGFDLSSLNLSGKTLGIGGAVVGVLLLGYFLMGSSLFESWGAGAIYEETVKLHDEYKKVADKDASSPEFTGFYSKFKDKHRQLLSDLGTPSRGSSADEVRRAVLALGTVIEAQRRPEYTKADREPFLQTLDQQMKKLKQTFGS